MYPPSPALIEKYLYILKTPEWKVRALYLFGIVSWLLVSLGYLASAGTDPFFSYFLTPVTLFLTLYHLSSFGLNLFYKQFSLRRHFDLISKTSSRSYFPSVDIFLPICNEDYSVLKNTWKNVKNIDYDNKTVYVLDDSTTDTTLHEALAKSFGFTYLKRPNQGEMKKAGNLLYGFKHSRGEFIAIFDADFAPHKDFIKETLPYMQDYSVGIVQTPQYFETSKRLLKKNPLAYNAAFAEEPFYRFIQVSRDRFGGAICCGSNALYRRASLEAIGGPYQIGYSEDAHTGFELISKGFKVKYLPIILAIGSCPSNHYTFFHQQHRWCMGSMSLMLSKKFWKAKIPVSTKICYITGFLFYIHHPVIILFSFHLFWVLFLYSDFIPGGLDILYIPHLIFAILYVGFLPIARLNKGYFVLLLARTYAYSHAVITSLLGRSVLWISTNARQTKVSIAYQQTMFAVVTYLILFTALSFIGFRTGDLRILNLDYWSLQIWILVNMGISFILLLALLGAYNAIRKPLELSISKIDL